MKYCYNCKIKLDDEVQRCPQCNGTKFAVPKRKPQPNNQNINVGSQNNNVINNQGNLNQNFNINQNTQDFNYQQDDNFSFNLGDTNNIEKPKEEVNIPEIRVGQWILVWLQLAIPGWNLLYVVKTLSSSNNVTLKNYMKSYVITTIISIALSFLLSIGVAEYLAPILMNL